MPSIITHSWIALTVLLVGLSLTTAVVYRIAGLGHPRMAPLAAQRGAVQLAAVAAVLAAALARLWSSVLVLVVMFAAAAFTAARRARAGRSAAWLAAAMAAGIGVVLPPLLLSGVVPLAGVAIVPIGGIVLGNAMTATALAAKRSLDAIDMRYGEIEGGLSLGMSERDARMTVLGPAAADALLPGLDQTRTVGLVTLPGAFVGVLLASGSAVEAGAVQLLVLVSLLLAQSVAVAVAVELVARGIVHRAGAIPGVTGPITRRTAPCGLRARAGAGTAPWPLRPLRRPRRR